MTQHKLSAVPKNSVSKSRQQVAIDEINERQAIAPFGMKTVDAVPLGRYIDVDGATERATKYVLTETPIPLWRRLWKLWKGV